MKKTYLVNLACNIICCLFMFSFKAVPVNPPEATITNGLIRVHLYLPDAENGYYRATRFDWSGVISNLEFNKHSYYGQWYKKYSPTINDAIMGPVEAFDPLGYDEAKPGENFMKIGVGVLTKIVSTPYNSATYYPIVDVGKWTINIKKDQVQFSQKLRSVSYSYDYKKTVKLLKNKPVMVISHTLKNRGNKTITTSVFNHNFLVIDNQPTGPGFEVGFPIADEMIEPKMEDLVKLQGNQLVILKEMNQRNVYLKDLTNGKGADYIIKVENHNTGAGVKITADRRISKLAFWCAEKTICPEPFINIQIKPGQSFTWNINYEYYINEVTHTISIK